MHEKYKLGINKTSLLSLYYLQKTQSEYPTNKFSIKSSIIARQLLLEIINEYYIQNTNSKN